MKRSPPSSARHSRRRVTGTIHCSVLDTHGDLGCTTTTSGLSWKIPGRVGDSPILGAGLFLDNEVGSAGSTGVGELNLLNLSSAMIVEGMRRGLAPQGRDHGGLQDDRARCTKDPKRRRKDGRLAGNVSFYAVSKDGKFAGGSIYPGGRMAVHDGDSARLIPCDPLVERGVRIAEFEADWGFRLASRARPGRDGKEIDRMPLARRRSILIGRDHFAAVEGDQARRVTGLTESLRNATWPSPNRTLAPPGWNEAISSLLPALLPWATNGVMVRPVDSFVVGAILVIGCAGDAETLVGLGPAPEAAIGRIAARRARVDRG